MRDTSAESHVASGVQSGRKAQPLREWGRSWWQQVMRLFFTSETSLSGQKIADLQRRACWVGVAVILQFWNEALRVGIQAIESNYTSTVTLLDPTSNLILIALMVGSFLALWMAFRPARIGESPINVSIAEETDDRKDHDGAGPPSLQRHLSVGRSTSTRLGVNDGLASSRPLRSLVPRVHRTLMGIGRSTSIRRCVDEGLAPSRPLRSPVPHAHRTLRFAPMGASPVPAEDQHDSRIQPSSWQLWICSVCLILAVVGVGAGFVSILHCFMPMQFSNDGTVLDTNAAVALLHGDDPYAHPNLGDLNLMHDVSIHAEWTTPLRRGRFAGKLEYPTNEELEAALRSGLKTTQAQEFETKVSYPALSFISLVPFALFNHLNVLPLYILCHLLLIAVAWKYARPELRPWILLLAFANVSTWTTTVGETLDMFYISLLTLAWLVCHRRWFSLILLGLAVASKQTAWFFVPFYAMMVYWRYGFKEALGRVVAALGIGLAINLPFILWGPSDWLAGVMAPLVDPMFPMGTGLIALSIGHVISFLPTQAYQILEWTAYSLSLIYYWFRCRRAPEAAMLLAVLFLFFAWRSLPSYFYCSAFPLLVLMLKKTGSEQADSVQHNSGADAGLLPATALPTNR